MGCTTSKQARRDLRRCPSLPTSMERRHPHPAAAAHLAALPRLKHDVDDDENHHRFSDELMKKMANDRSCTAMKTPTARTPSALLQTPTVTPQNEPDIINAWELMEGLEDITPLRPSSAASVQRSFSFSAAHFNPSITSAPRSAFAELTATRSFNLRCSPSKQRSPDLTGIVKARVRVFQDRIDAKRLSAGRTTSAVPSTDGAELSLGGDRRVVIYVTSLQGIRQTFEDCCYVRMILHGYKLRIDERDVSMHAGFKDELYNLLNNISNKDECNLGNNKSKNGEGQRRRMLPAVFANGRHIGGAEEVRRLHEARELAAVLEGCEKAVAAEDGSDGECEGCGGVRFVMCNYCSGSCKVFVEEDEEENDGGSRVFRQCWNCNEYGLAKCHFCW